MGFVRDVAKIGSAVTSPFGLVSLALGSGKKKTPAPTPQPTMISNTSYQRPMSMIGSPRGDY